MRANFRPQRFNLLTEQRSASDGRPAADMSLITLTLPLARCRTQMRARQEASSRSLSLRNSAGICDGAKKSVSLKANSCGYLVLADQHSRDAECPLLAESRHQLLSGVCPLMDP
jgi:hypothetical protein